MRTRLNFVQTMPQRLRVALAVVLSVVIALVSCRRFKESIIEYICRKEVEQISEPPNILTLAELNFFTRFRNADIVRRFGTFLLRDSSGAIVDNIFATEHFLESRVWMICVTWLDSVDKDRRTWSTLITVLEQVKLNTLAEFMQTSVDKKVLHNPHQLTRDS